MQSEVLMKPQEIANAIYGLQNYSLQYDSAGSANNEALIAVYQLLTQMLNKLARSAVPAGTGTDGNEVSTHFSSQDVGVLLYGLKNMAVLPDAPGNTSLRKLHAAVVTDLVCAIADRITAGPPLTNSQAISNALYGLNSMSADVPGE